jgi:hypothetical protein
VGWVASTPPGEGSPADMDAITNVSYEILNKIAEMKETLVEASDQLTNGQKEPDRPPADRS